VPKLRHTLDQPFIAELTNRIKGGAYPHVAAESLGVPAEVFESWITRGEAGKVRKPLYRQLALAVRQAQAHARLMAEMAMRTDDPKTWLTQGPGREASGRPGWTMPIKPVIRNDNRQVNILLEPQLMGIFSAILQILTPFPEARAAVAAALAGAKDSLPAPQKK
jgi:hypothetical protein